jgi:hypothetical protein
MKILLGDFNVKMGRKDIFKPTTGNENLLQDRREHGVKSSKLCHIRKI